MKNYRSKIGDYFQSDIEASERKQIEDWIIENENSTTVDEELKAMLDEVTTDENIGIERAFERFRGEVRRRGSFSVRYANIIRWTQRVAAVMLLPLLLSTIYLLRTGEEVTWKEVYVARGQKQELTLPDGTKLWINSDSRVTYPLNFRGRTREIFIDGEIYADVAKDPKHPFIVSSDQVQVEVLGTQFNFRSYREDNKVELALSEGKVLMSVGSGVKQQSVYLMPSDLAVYNKESGELRKTSFNLEKYSLTYQNNLYFYNEKLSDIANQLSRHFDQRIVITDPSLEQMTFYALFTNNESLEEILNTFNADKLMNIEHSATGIYISIKNN
ncbi:MAG: FecR domain-containing protein [Rikenellaceae bacterium]